MCLAFADLNSTASLGPVLAVGVGVTLLVMVTLLPALLVIFGRWIFWPVRPVFGSPEPTQTGFWSRVGNRISVRPRAVWIGTAVILRDRLPRRVQARRQRPLHRGRLHRDPRLGHRARSCWPTTTWPTAPTPIQVVTNDEQLPEVQAAVADIDGLGTPTDPVSIGDGRSYFEVPIKYDLASEPAFDIVDRRARRGARRRRCRRAGRRWGGVLPRHQDRVRSATTRWSSRWCSWWSCVILVLLLRALLAPLILIGTVILSFGAALGLSSLLFHYVFDFAGADAGFPLFAFVFLVALGVDYNIFLMTRVREETVQHGTRKGSLIALSSTGGVITSAGLVLAATFLVLATLPFVFLVELGTAVALGVLLDTLIVRSVLVTALNLDLGGKIWWPSKLDRGDHVVDPGTAEPERESVTV